MKEQGAAEEAQWQTVLDRDKAADGKFVYAVSSTKIYCRPSCPSRRPSRKGVRFFAEPADAREAGYRACLRCQPDGPSLIAARVTRTARALESQAQLSLDVIAVKEKTSPEHLQRQFKAATGISPRAYSQATKTRRMRENLLEGQSVLQAGLAAGFGSGRGIYAAAQDGMGMTPATYGKRGKGAHMRYAIVTCPLGTLLVATTDTGVCFVALGDMGNALEGELQKEFPLARLERDDKSLASTIHQVLALIAGELPHQELPLDVQATAFQWRVWQELRRIPPGEAISYAELARRIGQPTAVRAVARANATNPVALVHPCHRVVGSDGSLTGYRWGVERKAKLLEAERQARAVDQRSDSEN